MIFSNKQIKYIISIFLIFTLSGCNIFKKNIKNNKNPNVKEIENIEDKVNLNALIFKTFTAGFSGNYTSGKQKLPLKGLLKIKKDTFIWITVRPFFGIEVARILLTSDSIKYIDKINNQYFIEDFHYLNKKFGFDINYHMIESLLTNKIIIYPEDEKLINYTLNKNEDVYTMQKENQKSGLSFIHSLSVNNNFLLIKNQLFLKDKTKSIIFDYENFSKIYSKEFPHKIIIKTKNGDVTGNAILELKNITIDSQIKAKFKIPDNYKRIRF